MKQNNHHIETFETAMKIIATADKKEVDKAMGKVPKETKPRVKAGFKFKGKS